MICDAHDSPANKLTLPTPSNSPPPRGAFALIAAGFGLSGSPQPVSIKAAAKIDKKMRDFTDENAAVIDRRYNGSTDRYANCIAWLADFFFVHNRAGRVLEIAFSGRGVDGRCPEKEADFLR